MLPHVTSVVTNTDFKEAFNNNLFVFIALGSGWFVKISFDRLLLKNDQLHLTKFLKFVYNKLSLLFVSQLRSVLGKTHQTIRVSEVPMRFFGKLKNEIQSSILRFCFYFNKEDEIQITDYHFHV